MDVHVLFRFSKKTGKIDTTMTGVTSALMKMWALQNTTKSKQTIIFNRETGACILSATGTADGLPEIEKGDLGTCEDYNIPLDILQSIKDERFDNTGR
jgi:hypothetical protein